MCGTDCHPSGLCSPPSHSELRGLHRTLTPVLLVDTVRIGGIQRCCGLLSEPPHGDIFINTVLCIEMTVEIDIASNSPCFDRVNVFTFIMR